MKNNKIKKIEISKSGVPINRFPLTRDVHTTFGFGECQPTFFKEMEPNSSITLQKETLALLAPMVAPTMGRMSLETFGMFVPKKDVFPCYEEFLSQTDFNYGGLTFRPSHHPQVPHCVLSALVLIGAGCSVFKVSTSGAQESYISVTQTELSDFIANWRAGYNENGFLSRGTGFFGGLSLGNSINLTFNSFVKRVAPSMSTLISEGIPLYNKNGSNVATSLLYDESDNLTHCNVTPTGADFIVTFIDPVRNYKYAFCFQLSAFGKRIHKILTSLRYEINFNSNELLDVTPLLAWYKAYYDLFGIVQWSNWQDTPANKVINTWLSEACPANISEYIGIWQYFTRFAVELGRCWFTDEQDYISVHQANVTNNRPFAKSDYLSFIDVSSFGPTTIGTTNEVMEVSPGQVTGSNSGRNDHLAINRVLHSQVDSNLLKRIYKWTNRNSVIGQRVADLLRAQGFGDWVDKNKSNFVGHFKVPLKISNVVSQSDTYDSATDNGSLLGEYGGRGIGYSENDSMTCRTNEAGYFICISVVVPSAGYVQGMDLTLKKDGVLDCYQPEFDGLGMEYSPKAIVCGRTDIAREYNPSNIPELGFGFVPRSTKFKVIGNVNSGDFALRSYRSRMPQYTLDKLMYPGDIAFNSKGESNGMAIFNFFKSSFDYSSMPVAGVSWRYPTRYTWLANFGRIFAQQGSRDQMPTVFDGGWLVNTDVPEIVMDDYDNFIVHMVDNGRYYAHMLPIEASYETKDDGNSGKTDMEVSHA